MSWFYKKFIRPILFKFDPERIHNITITALSKIGRSRVLCDGLRDFFGPESMPVEAFGIRFPNPAGLAAGMDKDAVAVPVWEAMGFGFVEVGAITYHPQPGNPPPRVFRIVKEEAIINRMGFNNKGAVEISNQVRMLQEQDLWANIPVGVNIGKSKITSIEQAAEDYEKTFRLLWGLFDFFVVNVSSPNTPGLRQLQDKEELAKILGALNSARQELLCQTEAPDGHTDNTSTAGVRGKKPILVKIAPDLSYQAIEELLYLCKEQGVSGIVATNTTITRPQTDDPEVAKAYTQEGGLSGRPLKDRATEIIRFIYRQTKGSLPVIGVGGIFTPEDAWEKITAGATLIQVYTGLVYEGPFIAKNIVNGLYKIAEREGVKKITDVVGICAG